MEILRSFTNAVEPLSIDEAFLDVTGSRRAFGDGEEIARRLKAAIRGATQLTASVGVAASKHVAKIASDMRKPDGLVVVAPGTEAAFLAPLPIRRLWGVGPKMEERLARLGIVTVGALAALDPASVEKKLGEHGAHLQALARGRDEREVAVEEGEARSIGQERTFGADTRESALLRRTLMRLCDDVAARLRADGVKARTVTLKYRDETFHTVTRAETLASATDSGDALFAVASRLFASVHGERKVRLLGVYGSGFDKAQLGLFETTSSTDRLRDTLPERFGDHALTRASLLTTPRRRR
jgi:DNA polymerase-4